MYSLGLIVLPLAILTLGSIFLYKNKKHREYDSITKTGLAIIILIFGLIFTATGFFIELKASLPSKVFGYYLPDLFGELTPLAKLALNPFFMVGLTTLVGSTNTMLIAHQIQRSGRLTIPYEFEVEYDASGTTKYDWEIHYYYLDDYRGVTKFNASKSPELQELLELLSTGKEPPPSSENAFMVQYLENDPTYHHFWEAKRIPQSALETDTASPSAEE